MKDAIRQLQKTGSYAFEGLTREESKKAATDLAIETMKEDKANGIDSKYGIARDAFGYYSTHQINE